MHMLGAPPWLAERLFHASLLAFGALGTALLCRAFRPNSFTAPLVAGLWAIATPFAAGFLLPSWLYMSGVATPWLILAAYYGLTRTSTWRWAAIFVLLVGALGTINIPAMVWAALPLLPLVVYLLATGETIIRRVIGFAVRSGTLLALVILPSAIQSLFGSAVLSRTLRLSEGTTAISRSSSWLESFRGLGGSLLYFNLLGKPTLPYISYFLSNPFVVVITFVPVVIAFAVDWILLLEAHLSSRRSC